MKPVQVRRAFTLVELLVVIAIIGVLVALLLPAVQAAREAARRMSCQNNLKQLGLALHNHADSRGVLPPGGVNTGSNGTRCYTTWSIEILPFLEQQSLYQLYRQDRFNEDPLNRVVFQTRLKPHECPSDPLNGILEIPASGPHQNQSFRHGSYRAVSGRANMLVGHGAWDTHEPQLWPSNTMDKSYRGALHGTGTPFNSAPATAQTGTVTQMGGAERFANIIDGTSNSLMVGELTFGRNDVPRRATFWAYTYASYNQSSITAESRHLTNSYNKCAAAPGLYGDQLCKRAFGSFHPQGLNFVLCDGAVRWVSYNADINLLQNMATIEGGESQTLP